MLGLHVHKICKNCPQYGLMGVAVHTNAHCCNHGLCSTPQSSAAVPVDHMGHNLPGHTRSHTNYSEDRKKGQVSGLSGAWALEDTMDGHSHTHITCNDTCTEQDKTDSRDPHLLPWEWVRLLWTLFGANCSIWAECGLVCMCV